jgi:hypothetical protein
MVAAIILVTLASVVGATKIFDEDYRTAALDAKIVDAINVIL